MKRSLQFDFDDFENLLPQDPVKKLKTEQLSAGCQNFQMCLNQADSFAQIGNFEDAIYYYNQAAKLNPFNSSIFSSLAALYEANQDSKGAIESYSRLIELDPSNTKAYINRGILLAKQGDHEKAILNYYIAIHQNLQGNLAYKPLAESLKAIGDIEGAIENYNKAIELEPDQSSLYINLGMLLAKQGDYQTATEKYNKAIQLDPQNSEPYVNVAIILAEQGYFEEAIQNYNIAIEIDPENSTALYNLAVILEDQGDFEKALTYYDKAIKLNKSKTEEEGVFRNAEEEELSACEKVSNSTEIELNILNELKETNTSEKFSELPILTTQSDFEEENKQNKLNEKLKIVQGLKELYSKDKKLYIYAQTFYWCLFKYLNKYLLFNQLEANEIAMAQAIEKSLFHSDEALNLTSLKETIKDFPDQSVVDIIEGFVDSSMPKPELTCDQKKRLIGNLFTSRSSNKILLEEDLSIICAKTVLGAVDHKKNELLLEKSESKTSSAKKSFSKVFGFFKEMMKKEENSEIKSALRDITLLLKFIYTTNQEFNKDLTIYEIFIDVLKHQKWESGKNTPSIQTPSKYYNDRCNIF